MWSVWLSVSILCFTCEGKFLTSFQGTLGSGPGQFKSPRGIEADKNGVVYISDSDNSNCLQLFQS